MAEISIPLDGVRACVGAVDDAAGFLADLVWPTLDPAALPESAVGRTVASAALPDAGDRLVAGLRSWATATRAAVTRCEEADARHARGLPSC